MKSNILVLEGINGCGKSSVCAGLMQSFANLGIVTSGPFADPGSTEIGDALRAILKGHTVAVEPIEQLFLYTTARIALARHLREMTMLEIKQYGKPPLYILDRWVYSTYAYQGAGGVPFDAVTVLHTFVQEFIPCVHGVYLRIPAETAFQRTGRAAADQDIPVDRFEALGGVFLTKVCEQYDAMAERGELHAIDATQPLDRVIQAVTDYAIKLDRSPSWLV
jgi:dTMP kinase